MPSSGKSRLNQQEFRPSETPTDTPIRASFRRSFLGGFANGLERRTPPGKRQCVQFSIARNGNLIVASYRAVRAPRRNVRHHAAVLVYLLSR